MDAGERIEKGPEIGPEISVSLQMVEEIVRGYHEQGQLAAVGATTVRRDLEYRLADGEITDEQAEEVLYRLGIARKGSMEGNVQEVADESIMPASQIAVLGIMRGHYSDAHDAADKLLGN